MSAWEASLVHTTCPILGCYSADTPSNVYMPLRCCGFEYTQFYYYNYYVVQFLSSVAQQGL